MSEATGERAQARLKGGPPDRASSSDVRLREVMGALRWPRMKDGVALSTGRAPTC
jgi:hypothetical protein